MATRMTSSSTDIRPHRHTTSASASGSHGKDLTSVCSGQVHSTTTSTGRQTTTTPPMSHGATASAKGLRTTTISSTPTILKTSGPIPEPHTRAFRGSKNKEISDFYEYKGDYLKLKNVQIGYTIPQKWTTKAAIQELRFYVSGENLLTITKFPGMDPELGATIGYPLMRQVSIGAQITF